MKVEIIDSDGISHAYEATEFSIEQGEENTFDGELLHDNGLSWTQIILTNTEVAAK